MGRYVRWSIEISCTTHVYYTTSEWTWVAPKRHTNLLDKLCLSPRCSASWGYIHTSSHCYKDPLSMLMYMYTRLHVAHNYTVGINHRFTTDNKAATRISHSALVYRARLSSLARRKFSLAPPSTSSEQEN